MSHCCWLGGWLIGWLAGCCGEQVFDKRSGRQVRWLGGGGQRLSGDAQLLLSRPERVVVDGASLFVSDTGHHR